jgi:NAD(P)-dependent dehydrogenase (short-subunit alcohol dehydrogenase family)
LRQIASGFVANGARVYISSRSEQACTEAAAQLTAAGPGTCFALPEDLATVAACERLASRLAEREPALHGAWRACAGAAMRFRSLSMRD